MNKPHKHADLIKAWADGAEVEYRTNSTNEWKITNYPDWSSNSEYRIKPQPKDNIMFSNSGLFDINGIERKVEFIYNGETGELISSRVLL